MGLFFAVPLVWGAVTLYTFEARYAALPSIEGVPVEQRRSPRGDRVARALAALRPHVDLDQVVVVLVEEEPGPPPKRGGWTTTDAALPFGLGGVRYLVHIDPRAPGRVLVHEVIEHVRPHQRGRGWNRDHTRPDLTRMSERLQEQM